MSIAETNAPRRRAYTDLGVPQLPEPTYAERVRRFSLSTIATLSTVSRKRRGYRHETAGSSATRNRHCV